MVDPQHFCDQVEVQVEGLGASVHVQTMRRDSCILFTPQTLPSKSNHSGNTTESGLILLLNNMKTNIFIFKLYKTILISALRCFNNLA